MANISVVIPALDGNPHRAISSVLNQSYRDIEIVLVASRQVLAGQEIGGRIRAVEFTGDTVAGAVNRGLRESVGAFLSVLMPQDTFSPERFMRLLPIAQSNPEIGLLGSDIGLPAGQDAPEASQPEPRSFESSEKNLQNEVDLRLALLAGYSWGSLSNFFVPRYWFLKMGPLRNLNYHADWEYALRLSNASRLFRFPEPLAVLGPRTEPRGLREQAVKIFEHCWCLAVHLPNNTETAWFRSASPDIRTEQLLHSLQTDGFEQVLVTLMAQQLWEHSGRAAKLLEPGNLSREKYLGFIEREIAARAVAAPRGFHKLLAGIGRRSS
jgi:hypothetical protein